MDVVFPKMFVIADLKLYCKDHVKVLRVLKLKHFVVDKWDKFWQYEFIEVDSEVDIHMIERKYPESRYHYSQGFEASPQDLKTSP